MWTKIKGLTTRIIFLAFYRDKILELSLMARMYNARKSIVSMQPTFWDSTERLVESLFSEHPVWTPTRSHVFVFEIWNTEANELDRIWSRTLGFIQSRLMPRLSYHRYCTSSHDNYTTTRTELISMLQLHRATNEESHFPAVYVQSKSCIVCHLQFEKPNGVIEFYRLENACSISQF